MYSILRAIGVKMMTKEDCFFKPICLGLLLDNLFGYNKFAGDKFLCIFFFCALVHLYTYKTERGRKRWKEGGSGVSDVPKL